jgi:Putative peptidoglycan binding domain
MTTAWHTAAAINVLLSQCNTFAPHRSRLSDGTIGDARHQALGNASDHNPWYHNTVTAVDITHDPTRGMDCDRLANGIIQLSDKRRKYLIWNRRIFEFRPGFRDSGRWASYSGPDPHTSHLHLSVMPDTSCELVNPWRIYYFSICELTDWNDKVLAVQLRLNDMILAGLIADGQFGPKTFAAVQTFQAKYHLSVDGIVGPATLSALGLQ